jgi:hypothetical protein
MQTALTGRRIARKPKIVDVEIIAERGLQKGSRDYQNDRPPLVVPDSRKNGEVTGLALPR